MSKLNIKHIFILSRITDKIKDLKKPELDKWIPEEEYVPIVLTEEEIAQGIELPKVVHKNGKVRVQKTTQEVGMELLWEIWNKLHLVEDEVIELIESLSSKNPLEMGINELFEEFKIIFETEGKAIMDFFKSANKSE